jgi:hypothetical protein
MRFSSSAASSLLIESGIHSVISSAPDSSSSAFSPLADHPLIEALRMHDARQRLPDLLELRAAAQPVLSQPISTG